MHTLNLSYYESVDQWEKCSEWNKKHLLVSMDKKKKKGQKDSVNQNVNTNHLWVVELWVILFLISLCFSASQIFCIKHALVWQLGRKCVLK